MLMRASERQQARGKRQTEPNEPDVGGDRADNGAYRRASPRHPPDTAQEQKQQRYRAQHEPDLRQGPDVDDQSRDHDPYPRVAAGGNRLRRGPLVSTDEREDAERR